MASLLAKVVKPYYLGVVLLGVSIVVYCCFAFSIGVIDKNNEDSKQMYNHPHSHPPWPSLQSPMIGRRWRVLQSSAAGVAHPGKGVVLEVEKALHGMGTLFRRGTRPMRELIVAHLLEETSVASLRVFLRTLHRSGATARADVVVLFPGASDVSPEVLAVFHEEEASFQKMMALCDPKTASKRRGRGSGISNATITPFNWLGFKRAEEEQHVRGEVIWGRSSSNSSSSLHLDNINPTWAGYGSIVGFEMQDLDPHNVLSGFFEDSPAQLRRWVCYEMLLGMVRTKYRNTLITQANVVFVGDPLAAVRRRQHLYLTSEDRSWLDLDAEEFLESDGKLNSSSSPHGRALLEVDEDDNDTDSEGVNPNPHPNPPPKHRNSMKKGVREQETQIKGLIPSVYGNAVWQSLDKAHQEKTVVSSNFAMGRTEYVRKLANKMTTEVVRIALEKKTRRPFHDKAVLNYLVHQSSVLGKRVLDHVKIVANKDSVVHSLVGSKQPNVFRNRKGRASRYAIIQGLANTRPALDSDRARKIIAEIHSDICQSPAESQVYQDCSPGHAPGLYSW
ncbi:hypothetical protein M758_5G113000 [Ceratodon purpureus]|nr:hypothetical protein M758_5G113000 [Ceratodon purpureus]